VFALSNMVITLCLAVLSWRLVEAPALRLKRYTDMKFLRAGPR